MHSDIIKSVSRLITERKHTISSALVWSAQQATSDFLLFLSLLPPEVNIGKPNPLRVCTRTNTPTQHVIASFLQELQVIHGRLVTALRCAPLCGESLNTGTNVKGGGGYCDVCVCVWTSERCGSSADNPNLTLSAARWAVFAEIKHIFRATLTAGA